MMLVALLAVVCLACTSLSAMSITLKQGRYVVMFVGRKQNSNNKQIGRELQIGRYRVSQIVRLKRAQLLEL